MRVRACTSEKLKRDQRTGADLAANCSASIRSTLGALLDDSAATGGSNATPTSTAETAGRAIIRKLDNIPTVQAASFICASSNLTVCVSKSPQMAGKASRTIGKEFVFRSKQSEAMIFRIIPAAFLAEQDIELRIVC